MRLGYALVTSSRHTMAPSVCQCSFNVVRTTCCDVVYPQQLLACMSDSAAIIGSWRQLNVRCTSVPYMPVDTLTGR